MKEERNNKQGFTQQELESKVKEAQTTYEAEVTKAKEELAKKEEQLSKLKEKDLNFSNLRTQKEEAEKKIDALKTEMEEKVGKVKQELVTGFLNDHYQEALNSLAGGDEELKKKLEF